ncbi:MAG: rRNA maturation protein Nop10 [Oceanicoccus sp.]|jgi:rRNA maturation protein Nop10
MKCSDCGFYLLQDSKNCTQCGTEVQITLKDDNPEPVYDLLLSGKTTGQFPLETVKKLLSKTLKLELSQLNKAFEDENICIKRGLTKSAAKKFQRIFLSSGAYCLLKKVDATKRLGDGKKSTIQDDIQPNNKWADLENETPFSITPKIPARNSLKDNSNSMTNAPQTETSSFLLSDVKNIPFCPHCGSQLIHRIHRGIIRKSILKSPPLYKCAECIKTFSSK